MDTFSGGPWPSETHAKQADGDNAHSATTAFTLVLGALSAAVKRTGFKCRMVLEIPISDSMIFGLCGLSCFFFMCAASQKKRAMHAIPLLSLKGSFGCGGIAVNNDGTLMASVDSEQHCVHIYSMDSEGECIADPIIIGHMGERGIAHGYLSYPWGICFVHRGGTDSLLICDYGNTRIVETTAGGVFLRTIAAGSYISHVAYCGRTDVIAASEHFFRSVMLLRYESGKKTVASFGTGAGRKCLLLLFHNMLTV